MYILDKHFYFLFSLILLCNINTIKSIVSIYCYKHVKSLSCIDFMPYYLNIVNFTSRYLSYGISKRRVNHSRTLLSILGKWFPHFWNRPKRLQTGWRKAVTKHCASRLLKKEVSVMGSICSTMYFLDAEKWSLPILNMPTWIYSVWMWHCFCERLWKSRDGGLPRVRNF